jgi:hypothetical protein
MIIEDLNFHRLHETDEFVIGHVFEDAYLINKINTIEIYLGDFYGDPTCGLISSNNDWCLVGGSELSIWMEDGNISRIKDDELYWICKIRQTAPYEVELLIDAWTDETSVWAFNIKTGERRKIKNYKKLNDEYSEHIDW